MYFVILRKIDMADAQNHIIADMAIFLFCCAVY